MARTDRHDRHRFLLYGKAVTLLTPYPEHISPLAISLASSGCIAVRAASRIDIPLVELGHNLIVARDARAQISSTIGADLGCKLPRVRLGCCWLVPQGFI